MLQSTLLTNDAQTKGRNPDLQMACMICPAILVSIVFVTGCGREQPSHLSRPTRPDETQVEPGKNLQASESPGTSAAKDLGSSVKPVDLIEANWNELQSLVSQQKGKIVVVDVWSTACEPCMKEFPHLIAMQSKYPDEIVTVSFDIDYVGIKNKPTGFYRDRVIKFLGSQVENRVLHRMCTTPADELFTQINLDSIPAIYVYGTDGRLAKRFEGSDGQGEGVSYEKQIIPFVEGLIKK